MNVTHEKRVERRSNTFLPILLRKTKTQGYPAAANPLIPVIYIGLDINGVLLLPKFQDRGSALLSVSL